MSQPFTNNSYRPISNFDFFFERIGYYLEKGKGISIYCSTEETVRRFLSRCEKEKKPFKSYMLSKATQDPPDIPPKGVIVVLIQDFPLDQLVENIEVIADQSFL